MDKFLAQYSLTEILIFLFIFGKFVNKKCALVISKPMHIEVKLFSQNFYLQIKYPKALRYMTYLLCNKLNLHLLK